MKFGEYLVKANLISEENVNQALRVQKYIKKPLGRILRDQGLLDDHALNGSLLKFSGGNKKIASDELIREINQGRKSPEVAIILDAKRYLQISLEGQWVRVLATNFDDQVAETIFDKLNLQIEFVIVTHEIFEFIAALDNTPSEGLPKGGQASILNELSDDEKLIEHDAYTSLFRDCINASRLKSASDIHIEPDEDGIHIRFRVFGDLSTWKRLGNTHKRPFVNAVKRLSNLQIGLTGVPQDGRITLKNSNLDIRVSCLPTVEGEKIVLRLLDKNSSFLLSDRGFCDEVVSAYRDAIGVSNGLILLSGATSSGKTTTLYSLLNSIDKENKNIVTVEDPVEFTFKGIHQVSVSKKIGFDKALRAILRQDPDVILVGEVRDKETADLCFQAAATGHLVLSSIHANGAAEIVGRLENLGMDRQTVRENLRYVFSQKLIKEICSNCSLSSANSMKKVGQGCCKCQNGYTGRTPIVEFMNENHIKRFIDDPKNLHYGLSFSEALNRKAYAGVIDARWSTTPIERQAN